MAATGRLRGPGSATSGTFAVWEYLTRHWRRYFVSGLAESLVTPVVYLLALGVGLGTLVDRKGPSAALGGVPYLRFVAPALLVAAALNAGVSEAAWPTYARFRWSRMFFAAIATPARPAAVADGVAAFLATRVAAGTVGYYLVLVLFRAAGGPAGVLMIPVAVLTAASCAHWVLVLASTAKREGNAFNALNRFVILPMTLFSGSFFPVGSMPAAVRWLAWVSPVWHGNELARGAALGTLQLLPALGHLLVLLALAGSGLWVARRTFSRRLIV